MNQHELQKMRGDGCEDPRIRTDVARTMVVEDFGPAARATLAAKLVMTIHGPMPSMIGNERLLRKRRLKSSARELATTANRVIAS